MRTYRHWLQVRDIGVERQLGAVRGRQDRLLSDGDHELVEDLFDGSAASITSQHIVLRLSENARRTRLPWLQ